LSCLVLVARGRTGVSFDLRAQISRDYPRGQITIKPMIACLQIAENSSYPRSDIGIQ
jgi:hypothetical protein